MLTYFELVIINSNKTSLTKIIEFGNFIDNNLPES